MKVLVDAGVHSEHGKVIRRDFKPGSIDCLEIVRLLSMRFMSKPWA
jgi:hypothetical protein